MNILFLCDMHSSRPWFRDRLPGLKKAASKYAHNIIIRDIYEIFGKEVSKHLREHVARDQRLLLPNIEFAEKDFLHEVSKHEIDTIIFATADNYREFLSLNFIMDLKSRGYNLVGFLGDDEFNHHQYKYLAAVFDNFVVYVEEYKKYYEKITGNKGYLLLNSCHIEDYDKLIRKPNYKYDTVLIGGPITARVTVLRRLKKEGFSIAIYGPETWKLFPDLAENYKGFVKSEDFDDRLSEGRIILSMLEDHITGKMHMNTKIWECARAGCFTIATNYQPLFSNYGFNEGTNIVTYQDETDLISKFKYYHKNSVDREKIRINFLTKVNDELDYEILYHSLFEKLKNGISKINITDYESAHKNINLCSDKYDGVYYNVINANQPVKQYFPFITPRSIFHFDNKIQNNFLRYLYFLLRYRNYYHINLYTKIPGRFKLSSRINHSIHTIKYKYLKPFYQKYLIALKKKIQSV